MISNYMFYCFFIHINDGQLFHILLSNITCTSIANLIFNCVTKKQQNLVNLVKLILITLVLLFDDDSAILWTILPLDNLVINSHE